MNLKDTSFELLVDAEPLLWFVAHTKPRCEKKLAAFCEREGFPVTLPLYRSIKKYQRKTITFNKPLFSNYVFVRLYQHQRERVYQNDHVANLLDVSDQKTFKEQLDAIIVALETEYEVCLMPHITAGKRVRIKAGPLRGMEGYVEERQGKVIVLLRLDFISQAAGVKVDASEVEAI